VATAFTVVLVAALRPGAIHGVARVAARVIVAAAGARLHVEGEFPREGTFIVMANHSSFIDLFVLPAVLRGRYTGVMAEEMMGFPLLRPILRRLKVVPIAREEKERALASLEVAAEALREGYQVALLPEGTRTLDGRLRPFKSGGFYMAVATHAPILPLGIAGAYEYKPKNRWTISPGPITVRIGRPTDPAEYDALGTTGLKEQVRAQIAALVGEEAAS
jgi:1-acyl-sn-glycerol-3-phosphate acyltransferase